MFESIYVKRHYASSPNGVEIDIGLLCESMLFYETVTVLADYNNLVALLKAFGPDLLMEYMARGHLGFAYVNANSCIMTNNTGTKDEIHFPTYWSMPDRDYPNGIDNAFIDVIGKQGRGRRCASRFSAQVDPIKMPLTTSKFALELLSNKQFTTTGAGVIFDKYCKSYRHIAPLSFECSQMPNGRLRVSSSINYQAANKAYQEVIPASHSSLNDAYILAKLFSVINDWELFVETNGEMAIPDESSEIMSPQIAERYLQVLGENNRKSNGEARGISAFNQMVLGGFPNVASVINRKARSLEEFLHVLDNAIRFKKWVKGKDANADIVKEYIKDITAICWADKLPGKSVRWAMFTGIGAAIDYVDGGMTGKALGVAASAFDEFIIDRIIKGWNPSHFVQGSLIDFINIAPKEGAPS